MVWLVDPSKPAPASWPISHNSCEPGQATGPGASCGFWEHGRDPGFPGPPIQIPACGTTALGSCLGSDAQALLQAACRTRVSACCRRSRCCARCLVCCREFPLARPLSSIPSAGRGAPPPLFGDFPGTTGLSDFPRPFIVVLLPWDLRRGPRHHPLGPAVGSPDFRAKHFHTCTGSQTARGRRAPCPRGARRVAFRCR